MTILPKATVKDHLIDSLLKAGKYNKFEQIQPAAILWPDKNRLWEPVIKTLQQDLPELLVYGEYQPDQNKGPAIWLKCMIASTLPQAKWSEDRVPVIYLPGVSRSDLRAIEDGPRALQPLAELQYRGVFWTQQNSRDWSLFAFCSSQTSGLGLDMAGDRSTLQAARRSLGPLLYAQVKDLQGRRLEAEDFEALLVQDPIQDLLLWLNAPEAEQGLWDQAHWETFCARCQKDFGFHPEQDGPLAAAEKLIAAKDKKWKQVWKRFQQVWRNYPQIPAQLEKTRKPHGLPGLSNHPAENKEAEGKLRTELKACAQKSEEDAAKLIRHLEKQHGHRRDWLWAEMDRAPLAQVLGHLNTLVDLAQEPFGGFSVQDMGKLYNERLWMADNSAVLAHGTVQHGKDQEAVEAALHAVYLPWLKRLNEQFQALVKEQGYPGMFSAHEQHKGYASENECWLFVDGLRLDTAYRLQEGLNRSGLGCTMSTRWAAVPSVTATGRVAVSPLAGLAGGQRENKDFVPVYDKDQTLLDTTRFRKLMRENGWQILGQSDLGDPSGKGWAEAGDLDHFGHTHGRRLSRDIPNQLQTVQDYMQQLFDAGWKKVRVVTDHGWLLLPGGLPKAELSSHVTETKWGRCALLKPTASPTDLTFGWSFCKDVQISMAPGVSSYFANRVYAHGGLSLQECLIPELVVQVAASSLQSNADIQDLHWLGLRCRVQTIRTGSDMKVDVRTKSNDPGTTLLEAPKQCEGEHVSVLIADDSHEGKAAFVVILDAEGNVQARKNTVIGGDDDGA